MTMFEELLSHMPMRQFMLIAIVYDEKWYRFDGYGSDVLYWIDNEFYAPFINVEEYCAFDFEIITRLWETYL